MTFDSFRTRLLASTIICSAMSGAAFAQTAPAAAVPAAESSDDLIVVTGTRIRQVNLESASPVTVVSAQEFSLTGTTRTEDLLNQLPQVFAGQASTLANGATGTATVDLRGLGAERTLVLVNGRRLMPGDPNSSAADLNAIPASLVKRVDVLTGGASSVYGADAVSGVVNFIMDTDFEGFKVDGQYSLYQHSNGAEDDIISALEARNYPYPDAGNIDGGTVDVTASFGAKFDDGRGHVTGYIGYRNAQAILQSKRDYSACSLAARTQAQVDSGLGKFSCGGSATSANGTVILNEGGTSTFFQVGPNRTLVPGFTPYNFGPLNYFQRPDERYTAGFFANYEISDAVKPYAEFMFMDDRTVAQIAPSGNFGNTLSINCDNPLLSEQQRDLLCDAENLLIDASGSTDLTGETAPFDFVDPLTGVTYNRGFAQILRRNVEGGGRQSDLQHTSYRMVAGVRGDLNENWNYDAYYQYGRTNYAQTYSNDFSVTRLQRALDVIEGPDGTPICRSAQAGGEDLNCRPWDIWGGTPSQESLNYLQVPGFSRGIVSQQVANVTFSGVLGEYGFQSPWADQGIGIAVGYEYRRENLEFNADSTFQTGDLAGQGAATLPVNGSYYVNEVFGEVQIPIIRDGFIHDFTISGGYRYSQYHNSENDFSTSSYKVEGEIAPIRDIRFRGSYNRAVRAPNIQELFSPQQVALDGSTDPCSGAVPEASFAACALQGVTAAQYGNIAPNPADQYNGFIGGNPGLEPETADTWTVGLVLQPSFVPRLAITVDYFNISIEDAIQPIGADVILDQCTQTLDPFFCGLVQRDQFGSLWRTANGFVIDTDQNIGGAATAGMDFNVSYNVGLGDLGGISASFVGTWLRKLETDTGVTDPYDCVGLYGATCGTPNPDWRHQLRVTYDNPNGLGLSVRWRYYGSVAQDTTELGGAVQPANAKLPSYNYIDLVGTFDIGENASFRIGINNLLDKDPPSVAGAACPAGACNGNTYPAIYDALGRYIFVGSTLKF